MIDNEPQLRLFNAVKAVEAAVAAMPAGDPLRVVDRLITNATVKAVFSSRPDRKGRIVVDLDQVAAQLERMTRSEYEPSVVRVPLRSWTTWFRDVPPNPGAPSGDTRHLAQGAPRTEGDQ